MSRYFSDGDESYFEEPGTTVDFEKFLTAKQVIDEFTKELEEKPYMINRPSARILGDVKKQD